MGCQLCFEEQRMDRQIKVDTPELKVCPNCKKKALFWNIKTDLYECFEPKCKKKYTETEFINMSEKGIGEDKPYERGIMRLYYKQSEIYRRLRESRPFNRKNH